MQEPIKFFNPYSEIRQTHGKNLPHWQQEGAVYFVTYRLFDSLPIERLRDWKQERERWRQFHPEPWSPGTEVEYHKRFTHAMERWLDAGHGCCVLKRSKCAASAMASLRYFDGQRIDLISAVVMPNHVHSVFVLNEAFPLEKFLGSVKKFCAREINHIVDRSGALWESDYFDRLVRDSTHFANCIRYIRRNPIKAHLGAGEYLLYENDMASRIG